jgi:hypothetical protein
MSLQVLQRDGPKRSIALASTTHVLIFQHNRIENTSTIKAGTPQCIVEFSQIDRVDLSDYKPLRHSGVYGTLGLINIDADVFVCIITHASSVATVRPDENVQRIAAVEFCSPTFLKTHSREN